MLKVNTATIACGMESGYALLDLQAGSDSCSFGSAWAAMASDTSFVGPYCCTEARVFDL